MALSPRVVRRSEEKRILDSLPVGVCCLLASRWKDGEVDERRQGGGRDECSSRGKENDVAAITGIAADEAEPKSMNAR